MPIQIESKIKCLNIKVNFVFEDYYEYKMNVWIEW